jgi:hypothetical protein
MKLKNKINYRSLASVRPHMDFELGTLSKAVAASFATEGFFVRVSAQMLEKMSFEGSLTDGTLERFHAAVVATQMFA